MKIDKFLQASPLFHSYRLFEQTVAPFQKRLKKNELTIRQSLLLIALYFEKKEITPGQLAQSLATSPSNISHALNYLEEKKWIQRLEYPGNRKKTMIQLTSKGEKRALKVIPIYSTYQDRLEERFGEAALMKWNSKAMEIIKYS